MLEEAERVLLAIRGEAEGHPEFRLALGETYARLGKTAESEAELGAVLKDGTPSLRMSVAHVYRSLGSSARAQQIGEQVFAATSGDDKENAAALLGVLAADLGHDDEAEAWYRKAGKSTHVAIALRELEAGRLSREGKTTECATKFAEIAKLQLAAADLTRATGYNNAALSYERQFDCSGDLAALRSAETALETAYRNEPDGAIVVMNLARVLATRGNLRVLSRHIDTRALGLRIPDLDAVIDGLLEGPQRDAMLAELRADPGIRRSTDLIAQAEVLMPNQADIYRRQFLDAYRQHDDAAAARILDRVRHAKALDVDEAKAARERATSGVDDAKYLTAQDATRTRLESILARSGGLTAQTRAAGWYRLAEMALFTGRLRNDVAMLARAREAAITATRLWPALDGNSLVVATLIDEAGLAADAKTWIAARRLRSAVGALHHLAAGHAPLADKIRASRPWIQVAGYARADASRRSPGDLRLARLLGDADLEARARPVLDDKLMHLALELEVVCDPTSEVAKAELAYLDAR
jgi:tetratricopeptide (TPR) repeat protein